APVAAADAAVARGAPARRAIRGAWMDAARPIAAGARLGRDPEGRPAWYLADPARPGKYLKVGT
ncbi:hypothetical protein, partial [Cognatiluteimonas weifangensis]